MSNRTLVLGAGAGLLASGVAALLLARAPDWRVLALKEPTAARALMMVSALPWPIAFASLARTLRRARAGAPRWVPRRLPPYPFDPNRIGVVLGEVHRQNGRLARHPKWLVLPEPGLFSGMLITGATGSGKTTACHYPFTAQLIRLHAKEPSKKFGGLVLDGKGNYAEFVRRQCEAAGRLADYHEVSMDSGIRYNIFARPDLDAHALAGHLGTILENLGGKAQEPFWDREAIDLATQCIRVIRAGERREPTLADLYRAASSPELFGDWLQMAGSHDQTPEMREELESVRFWLENKYRRLDPRLRASIAAGLNGLCSVFDIPKVRRVFCPAPGEETFVGFERLIADGQIVALKLPEGQFKNLAQVVGTMIKLNFFDATLNRLARASGDIGRGLFFLADEADLFLSQPGDGAFFARCREARCACILSTQSYSAIESKVRGVSNARQILSNLRTKIWLCAEEEYTARKAAELCGETDRRKTSRSRNVSYSGRFSFFDGEVVQGKDQHLGLSYTETPTREPIFKSSDFSRLSTNHAIVKAFDGRRAMRPWRLYLTPLHADPERGVLAREGGGKPGSAGASPWVAGPLRREPGRAWIS